jgi:hypothetical protein
VVGQKRSGRHVSCESCPLEKKNAKNKFYFILFFKNILKINYLKKIAPPKKGFRVLGILVGS